MKALFIVPHPLQGASYRYRVHQFLPYLEKENIEYTIRPFVSENFYKILYKQGHLPKKIFYTLIGIFKRLIDLCSLAKYDVIFIHLESSPFPLLLIEHAASLLKKPIVFDFDDAIFLKRENAINSLRDFLRSHTKISKTISLSSQVIVCNSYLKDFSKHYIPEERITLLPTSIDTEKFNLKKTSNAIPVIGWVGSHTTFPYLENLLDIFQKLSKKYAFILKIVGAPKLVDLPPVKIIQKEWKLEEEIRDFHDIDIGLYPLFDSEWAKGKASFKALQYMAAQVPFIASNVGRNKEVVVTGVNGFLATHKEEWIEKIELLLSSPSLRHSMGQEGRKTVEQHFSASRHAPTFVSILKKSILL